jgi:hypothetical protein
MAETYGYDPNWTTDLGVHHQANPTSLQGVLASIPGLGSYLAMDQYLRQKTQAERYQPQNDEMRQIILDTKRAELQKRQAANSMMQQFGGIEKATPDQLDQIALAHFAAGDHVNSAAAMKIADTKRARMQETAALVGMRSAPEVPAVGETGPNVPAPAKPGAVPDYLISSPYVGKSAQALRDRINTGLGFTSISAEKAIENLQTAHNTMAQRVEDQAAARQGRIDLRVTPPAGSERTAGAITNEAYARIINGKGTPGFASSGAAGEPTKAAVANKMEDIRKELGWTPAELATKGPENRTKFIALGSLEKDLAAIGPFHDMLNTNAKIAVQLADKIASSRTGSQLLNKPITWLQANAADNPDIAEYLFQIQTVKTEGARILNNPRLVGQLTDSARHEMGDVVNGNMPFGQTRRVLSRMMSDGDNRVNALTAQRDKTVQEIRGSAGGAPVQQPAAIPAPTGVAPVYVETRITPSGKRLGKKADGTIEEIK